MNIYHEILKRNQNNLEKEALSIAMDNGTLRSFTYKQLFELIDKYEKVMKDTGVTAGDRIAIISENCPEWDVAYMAIMKCNATAVLIDASLPKEEIHKLIDKSEIKAAYFSESVCMKMGEEKAADYLCYDVLTGSLLPMSCECENVRKIEDGDALIANIIFSSGTTKTASGIMHTYESMILTTLNCIEENGLKPEERFLSIIPNSHIYGVVCLVLGPLLLGAKVRFIETISGEAVVKAFGAFHPTVLPAVPKVYDLFRTQITKKIESNAKTKKMFQMAFPLCLSVRKKTGMNLGKKVFKSVHEGFGGSMRILCSAGAPMSQETAEFYYGTGFDILMTYGATETNIPTIGNRGKNITTNTCGTPYQNVEVKLSEEKEILIRSPYLMKGYFHDDEATKEAFTNDGWFKSGDLGAYDEKKNIRIVGRLKENLVLATGKKVAPDDIEANYEGISGVSEFVICGVQVDGKDYDEAHAFVVMEEKANEAEVVEAVYARSSEQAITMKVAKVHVVGEIPKTSLQKPKRYLLKQLAKQEQVVTSQVQQELAGTKEKMETSVEDRVMQLVAKVVEVSKEQVQIETKLYTELAMDSLNVIRLSLEIEEEFGVNIESHVTKESTVGDLIAIVKKNPERLEEEEVNGCYPHKKNHWDYSTFHIIRLVARYLYKVKVRNEHHIPQSSGYILCANHVSNFDYLYLTINFKKEQFKRFACMAKKELFKNTAISKHLAKVCGMVPVDRTGMNASAMSSLKDRLKKRWGVLIHPEGTRSKDGKLGKLKQGAALLAIEAGVPIVPAYIKGGFEIFPSGKKMPNLFNFKNMRRYHVDVIYGEPIYPIGMSAEELMRKVEQSIRHLAA